MTKGFIFIIVVSLVGVLAFLGILFVEIAYQSQKLSHKNFINIWSQILVLSGYEFAKNKYLEDFTFATKEPETIILGPGLLKKNGDRVEVKIKDLNARININDGIQAGVLEENFWLRHLGVNTQYNSQALDPYPTSRAEDILTAKGASGLINLRLRRLLNSYGEAHRFVDQVYEGNVENITKLEFYGVSRFTFSTPPANSADGPRATSMVAADPDLNTGLGDLIVSNRPEGGYQSLNDIEDLVNEWSLDLEFGLSSKYLGTSNFFEMIQDDLTIYSYEDDRFFRLYDEWHFGDYIAAEEHGDFKPRDQQLEPWVYTDRKFLGMYSGLSFTNDMKKDMIENTWKPHAVALINLNEASFFVKAAVFYAPTHVSYSCEGATTIPPYLIDPARPPLSGQSQGEYFTENTGIEAMIASPSIGVRGPIFDNNKKDWLNGQSGGRSSHLLSLRDALYLAWAYENYELNVDNFDDFHDFLKDHEENGFLADGTPPYERVLVNNPYDLQLGEDFNAGGLFHVAPFTSQGVFTQDYVVKTLPHILSCVRRIPSYAGAPAALQSPYLVLKPDYEDISGYGYQAGELCRQGFLKVEDFVCRVTHPKVCFLPGGAVTFAAWGEILDQENQVRASQELTLTVQLFETKYFRSQHDFDGITLDTTHEDITFGPDITYYALASMNEGSPIAQIPANLNRYMGVVGLKDFDQDVIGNEDQYMSYRGGYKPHIVMQFTMPHKKTIKDIQVPIEAFGNKSMRQDIFPHPTFLKYENGQDNWIFNSPDLLDAYFNPSRISGPDISGPSFFLANGDGNRDSDLSSFNGIFLRGHRGGEFSRNIFVDSLYWRLEDWLESQPVVGSSLSKGIMTFWFRVPSGYDYPTQVKTGRNYVHSPTSFTRLLAHLHLWEKYQYSPVSKAVERPVSISVGLKKTKLRGLNVFARYDSGGNYHNGSLSDGYLGPSDLNGKDFSTLTMAPYQQTTGPQYNYLGFWCRSDNLYFRETVQGVEVPLVYQSYRWVAHRSSEVSVSLANTPECGPGTWHRVTVFWNLHWDQILSAEEQLGLYLLDNSNMQGEVEYHQAVEYAPLIYDPQMNSHFNYPPDASGNVGEGGSAGLIMPYDSTMILSFGEAHARRLGRYTFNGKLSKEGNKYYPAWRWDSCIDNIRAWMGPSAPTQSSEVPEEYFDSEFLPSTWATNLYGALRYEVIHQDHGFVETVEPTWEIDPQVPLKSRLLALGARVYYPPDSSDPANTPYVYLSAAHELDGDPIEPLRVSKNEQNHIYSLNNRVGPNFRARLQYKAFKPVLDGDLSNRESVPLVYMGVGPEADHVTQVAWIKEVSFRYMLPEGARLLSLGEQSFHPRSSYGEWSEGDEGADIGGNMLSNDDGGTIQSGGVAGGPPPPGN